VRKGGLHKSLWGKKEAKEFGSQKNSRKWFVTMVLVGKSSRGGKTAIKETDGGHH